MKNSLGLRSLIAICLFLASSACFSQVIVESIVAIVGNEVVYLSDIENAVLDLRRNGDRTPIDELRCRVLHELLVSKLFLDQARIDSIEVTPDMVEGDLNMRINDAIRTAGSEKTLEDYFRKSMIEIRRDIRKSLMEQQIIMEVRSKIVKDLTITPADVRRFYNSIPRDSLPVLPARVQISLIQLDPPDNEANKAEARQKLLDIRGEILAGKSFNVLAVMYSEDPGSAANGGEIGFKLRGELEKEYADAAFSLAKNAISRIVETKYGFHLIQLIERKGEMANTRHILIRPKVKPEEAERAISKLDSLARLIRKDSLKFEDVAYRFSTHKDSRINGGKFVSTNPSERINWFTLEEFNREMYTRIRDLKIGEISDPFRTTDEIGNVVFRIVRLDGETPAHRPDLKNDYQYLYAAALSSKQQESYREWIIKKIETTYIKIIDEFRDCRFLEEEGWLK
ncbi:MAG TPA: peptidylprolyl isomerase [Bacteroidales bacterium]|nr:peptidylprolyl isomerase [Bacteroidales bacterium]HNR41410.1 peptidylprolyl isomerase [Bacteroidales bacterium]HPM18527.1 peptidylprolyl isomerase [Bacteroidales bacterium]